MLEFLKAMLDLRQLFDLGCEICVGEDGFSITGRDYWPSTSNIAELTREQSYMERVYCGTFDYDEDDKLVDTWTPLIEHIKADNASIEATRDQKEPDGDRIQTNSDCTCGRRAQTKGKAGMNFGIQ